MPSILTPPTLDARIAEASLRAGRHVLVEKPVAWKYGEIEKLQSAARKSNRVCTPGHNYIYVSALQRAKRLIDNGSLGTIASLWIIYNFFHPEEIAAIYGGALRAVCVHRAYSMLYLLCHQPHTGCHTRLPPVLTVRTDASSGGLAALSK